MTITADVTIQNDAGDHNCSVTTAPWSFSISWHCHHHHHHHKHL